MQLVLPLSDEPARSHDQGSADVATKHQLFDVEPGHDRLAGAGVVGQAEAQRLPGQHLAVDSDDLVREWLDQAEMNREAGVEQVGETDAAGLGNEPEKRAVAVEGPGCAPARRASAQLPACGRRSVHRPCRVGSEREHDASRACPARRYDGDRLARDDAAHDCARCQLLECCHAWLLMPLPVLHPGCCRNRGQSSRGESSR